MKLDAKTREYIERVAVLMESLGVPGSSGRMFGLLLVAARPLSLDQIADTLGVSKPLISSNARLYEQLQLLQRTTLPGDRRHYYQILPGAFERTAAARAGALRRFVDLAADGIKTVGTDNTVARARLDEMGRFYQHLADEMEHALLHWQQRKNE